MLTLVKNNKKLLPRFTALTTLDDSTFRNPPQKKLIGTDSGLKRLECNAAT